MIWRSSDEGGLQQAVSNVRPIMAKEADAEMAGEEGKEEAESEEAKEGGSFLTG